MAVFVITLIATGILGYLYYTAKNNSSGKSQLINLKNLNLPINPITHTDTRFEFKSDTPNYKFEIDNKEEFNKLVSDLKVFDSTTKPSKIIVTLVSTPSFDPGNLGYSVFTNAEKDSIVSISTSLFYPDQNKIEFIIYIDPNWLNKPTANTLTESITSGNNEEIKKYFVSFQFTYLLTNINYNKTLTLLSDTKALDPRLEYSKNKLEEWENNDKYPLKIANTK